MRINFFTPLPPARSDIANCVERILPALTARFDLRLYTSDENYSRSIEKLAPVQVFTPEKIDWRELNHSALSLFNIGNDGRFHTPIMQVAMRHPGVVILHDLSIHELAIHWAKHTGEWETYLHLLELAGEEAVSDWRKLIEQRITMNEMSTRYPLTFWPMQNSHGIIVHNGRALEDFCSYHSLPVLRTPLPYCTAAAMRPPFKRRPPAEVLELVICGYLNGPNRRLLETLQALASFPERARIKLHIAGRVAALKTLKEEITQLDLTRQVVLHGYLSDAELETLLDRVHLAVNLRYPTMGEASGAQLRYWNHCLPTIVTRTGWYSHLPENTVFFVTPDKEEADLHRLWRAAMTDYAHFAEKGLAGRRTLEEQHSGEVFAAALEQFLPHVDEHRKVAFAPKLARKSAMTALEFSTPKSLAYLKQRIANEIAVITQPTSPSKASLHAVARS